MIWLHMEWWRSLQPPYWLQQQGMDCVPPNTNLQKQEIHGPQNGYSHMASSQPMPPQKLLCFVQQHQSQPIRTPHFILFCKRQDMNLWRRLLVCRGLYQNSMFSCVNGIHGSRELKEDSILKHLKGKRNLFSERDRKPRIFFLRKRTNKWKI